MKHQIEKLIWRKEQSLGLGDDEHLNHEQIGELMVEFARGECDKQAASVVDIDALIESSYKSGVTELDRDSFFKELREIISVAGK